MDPAFPFMIYVSFWCCKTSLTSSLFRYGCINSFSVWSTNSLLLDAIHWSFCSLYGVSIPYFLMMRINHKFVCNMWILYFFIWYTFPVLLYNVWYQRYYIFFLYVASNTDALIVPYNIHVSIPPFLSILSILHSLCLAHWYYVFMWISFLCISLYFINPPSFCVIPIFCCKFAQAFLDNSFLSSFCL